MRKYEELRTMTNNHIIMLARFEEMLKKRFIPWFKKRSILLGDIHREERNLIHYIETELLRNLTHQKREAGELHKDISRLCEK